MGSLFAGDPTIIRSIQNSNLHELRELLTPGFCVTPEDKQEYQALAYDITRKTYAAIDSVTLTDVGRFIKGSALAAAGIYLCHLVHVRLMNQKGGFGDKMASLYDELMRIYKERRDAEDVEAVASGIMTTASTAIDESPFSFSTYGTQLWKHPQHMIVGGIGAILFFGGLWVVKDAINKKESYQRHCRALSVEAIIHRIPICDVTAE